MPEPFDAHDDPSASFARSAQLMAQTFARLAWMQSLACVLIGLSLLFTGYVVWQHLAQRQESAALNQAILTSNQAVLSNTQTIAAQTKAILEQLKRPQEEK
jgi:hypothetical protein